MEELPYRLEAYFDRLWPICRSITGPGYRQSMDILSEIMPMERLRFPSGRKVLDWTVPKEWVVRDAHFIGPDGSKHCDFKKNNLHLLNYSIPYSGTMPFEELKKHLHTLPEQPDAIPYLTSYYADRWGFCLTQREFETLKDGNYQVVIDTEKVDGAVEIGEAVLDGSSSDEILFSSYLCHPSLANNELSGPLALVFLYEALSKITDRRYTCRFILAPETIGSVCYLSKRGEHLKEHMKAGILLTCAGDPGMFTLKASRDGNTIIDSVASHILAEQGEFKAERFDPTEGADERQYCSPGYNLPLISLMRTMYGRFPEYHTSLDDKSFISFDALAGTVEMATAIVEGLEMNKVWVNTCPYGEPQLSPRGLFPTLGTGKVIEDRIKAMLWLLNFADGHHDLLSISRKSGQPMKLLNDVAMDLREKGLLLEGPACRSVFPALP